MEDEIPFGDHQHIDRNAESAEAPVGFLGGPVLVRTVGHDHQHVEVASGTHLAPGYGTEQDQADRPKGGDEPPGHFRNDFREDLFLGEWLGESRGTMALDANPRSFGWHLMRIGLLRQAHCITR
jgi:hypothetical protein